MQSPHFHSGSHPGWLLPLSRCRHLLIWLMLGGLSACAASDAQSPQSKDRAVPVVSAPATRSSLPLLVQTTGTVQAYSTVALKSQVDGQITGVYFQEGQPVRKGDLLFKIDPRPLQAALDQAVANRSKAVAQVAQAGAQLQQAEAGVTQTKANVAKG